MILFTRLKQMLHQEEKNTMHQGLAEPNQLSSTGEASADGKQNTNENDKRRKAANLTVRERELYLLLLEGFTLKEAANNLGVKYSTANTHMTSIYKKLEVNSRAQLIINYRSVN